MRKHWLLWTPALLTCCACALVVGCRGRPSVERPAPADQQASVETSEPQSPAQAAETEPPPKRRIAFVRGDGSWKGELWVTQADGSAPERLSECAFWSTIAWSPDARLIAFSRQDERRPGAQEYPGPGDSLWIVDVSTGGTRQLTSAESARMAPKPAPVGECDSYAPRDEDPSWSPDGKEVAFWRHFGDNEDPPELGIHAVSVQTGAVLEVDVSHAPSIAGLPEHLSMDPCWSPDGSLIAFESRRGDGNDSDDHLWTVKPDGRGERDLTPDEKAYCSNPEWSPDGRWIAYVADEDGESFVRLVGRTGEGRRTLAPADRWAQSISWSPDGRTLAIGSWEGSLRLVDVASGDVRMPAEELAGCRSPTWSPDGEWLAFSAKADGDAEIWLLNVQTGAVTQLTDNPLDDTSPQWAPAGVRAAQ